MIEKATIISPPISGEFEERIFDGEEEWSSPNWTWIKFENSNNSYWCGQFRGLPKGVGVSNKSKTVLVLTTDYLFHLDIKTGNALKVEQNIGIQNLTVTPKGDFIISDYYHLQKMIIETNEEICIESPVEMDEIKFKGWNNSVLNISCLQFLKWEKQLLLEYDCEINELRIKRI